MPTLALIVPHTKANGTAGMSVTRSLLEDEAAAKNEDQIADVAAIIYAGECTLLFIAWCKNLKTFLSW